MSDEYHQSGSNGSLVDHSIAEGFLKAYNSDFKTGNYPPQTGDSTSSGGFASTGPHPDTKPDAKELNISGSTESGQDLGLVGSGEPEGVDVRGEDAYGAAGARIPPAVELNNAPENTSIRHSGQIVTGEERVPYGRGNSLETRAEAEERLGGVYDAERGNA